ncbi:MAG: right-handed parallel beta-helix repeat-containing protein, partial [Candidatus Kaiserbacteria bacterium]|nr:right-handed parallel beta-helix repeat-containing protein [Candidatus Kaiserbacteria bacterium]
MLGGFLSFADHAFADTVVDSDISEDTAWTKAGSPYLVQGKIAVNQNAILSIEPGVIVQFDANGMAVFGRLLAKGSPDEPITFTSSTGSRWGGIEFYNQEAISSLDNVIVQHAYAISDYLSKNLSISNTKIKDGVYGIVAYGSHLFLENFSAENMSDEALDISYGSDVILKNLFLKNVEMSVQVYVNSKADISNLFIDGARGEALAVYVGSSVRVASSTIKNVLHSYGAVETFVNSSLDISNLTLEKVSGGDALAVFDDSKMFVLNSSISDTANSEVVSALYLGSLTLKNVKITNGTGDGLAVYAGGFVDVQDSVISGFTHGAGVADYGSNSSYYPVNGLSLTNSEIKDNNVGIGLYSNNSSYAISNNSIHQNASHGLESYGSALADVSSNFWGDSSGPYNDPDNLIGTGDGIWYAPGSTVIFSPWLSSWGIPPVSNVLFLPGLEASRLYRPGDIFGTDQLWEPNTDSDTQDLFLTADGKSVRNDVYTKDVIDEKNVLPLGQGNVYKSFIAQMDGLKTAGTINDWEAVPYDWRLSLDDILSSGNQFPDGRIYYSGSLAATSSPYLVQELRRLAKSSKTGKVTIVAHSNGGLVAKALTQKLGSEAANLIDKIIFVAVPQVGTPQAVGAILHGYDQGLPFDFAPLILTPETARTFATNMPSAYNLLPSANYFTRIATPVATFDNSDFLAEFRSRYGSAIQDGAQLKNFITDTRRLASSSPSDLKYPSVGNALLLSQAETVHSTFDAWTPPQGVPLYEIAGWGEDTLATIEYYKGRTASCSNPLNIFSCSIVPTIMYNPKEVVDGDGTVLVPSALWSTASTTKKYWVDLGKYNKFIPDFFATKHADILEVPSLRILVQNILTNSTSTAPLSFITTTQPITDVAADKRLRFVLHSPLNLSATDNLGNTVSSATSTIPGSRFKRYGEVQVL